MGMTDNDQIDGRKIVDAKGDRRKALGTNREAGETQADSVGKHRVGEDVLRTDSKKCCAMAQPRDSVETGTRGEGIPFCGECFSARLVGFSGNATDEIARVAICRGPGSAGDDSEGFWETAFRL